MWSKSVEILSQPDAAHHCARFLFKPFICSASPLPERHSHIISFWMWPNGNIKSVIIMSHFTERLRRGFIPMNYAKVDYTPKHTGAFL